MKKIAKLLVITIFFGTTNLFAQHKDYADEWINIDTLEMQGLPNSALTIVNKIFDQARADKDYPQFIKTFIYKMRYRSIIEWDVFAVHLQVAEDMADSASFPVKSIIHSMLAEMYWWYYQNKRYTFYSRSRTSQFVPDDIKTWDMNRIVAKVIEHYRVSLNESDRLKMINLADFKDILFYYRDSETDDHPTLYDFLALRAIDFFKDTEPSLTRPAEEFSMNNDDFFLPADTFARISIQTPDSLSFKYYALTMLQDLIRFHLNDSLPGTLVDIDLKRLDFVDQRSNSNDKDNLYLKSLAYLESKSYGFGCDAKVGITIAEKMFNIGNKYNPRVSGTYKWEKKKALEKCLDIAAKYPEASSQCNNFTAKVHEKSIQLTIEKENLPDEPFRALVAYRNTDSLYVRIIRTSYEEFSDMVKMYYEQNKKTYIEWNSFIIDIFRKKRAEKKFIASLPNDRDFQEHFTEIKIPALEKGLYVIMAGTSAGMDYGEHIVNYGITSVTNISYISRRNTDGSTDFYLLHRKTGLPLAGVSAKCMTSNYNYNSRESEPSLAGEYSSDTEGFIHVDAGVFDNKPFWVDFSLSGDEWSTQDPELLNPYGQFYNYRHRYKNEKDTKTFFFTDRSIYRPGQTIYFKGIVLETDGYKYNKIRTGEPTTVTLYDANSQEVSELKLVTNEYGSFSGSFTAPANGLNGQMTIEADNEGSISISVEDYKRPKFEVKYDTLRNSYKLGQMVKVQGHALAYSGANIDNASVTYRVVRKIRLNWWWDMWWNPRPVSPDKEITHGTTATDKNGRFELNFKAIPDESIAPSSNPVFTYVVYADVTDINGETHSAEKRISAGYKALLIKPEIPYYVEQNSNTEFKLTTCNPNGDFVPVPGTITICKLKSPDRIYRDRKWPKPDKHTLTKQEFQEAFPFDPYDDEVNPSTWDTEKTVLETPFHTGEVKTIQFPDMKNWQPGMYKCTMKSNDVYGDTIKEMVFFNLFDKKSKKLPYPVANWFVPTKDVCEPGENAEIVAGSGYSDGSRVLFEVESDMKIVQHKWVSSDNEQRMFTSLIKEEYRGNIGVHYTFVKNNRLYTNDVTVSVPYTNKALDIHFETFRNKLQPGEKDTWKLRVKGKNGDLAASEMVAALYDASLDAFKPQSFNFNIWPYYNPNMGWISQNCFDTDALKNYTQKGQDFSTAFATNQYSLNWFGFGYKVNYNPPLFKGNWVAEPGKSTFKIISSAKQKGTEISGIVYDASSQEPLPGVSIVIEGSNTGTVSDINGQFNISSVSDDVTLVCSFVGYVSEKVNLKQKGKAKILVNLSQDVQKLEEVVVVGYGSVKKECISASSVSVSTALQGKMPGLSVTNGDEPNEEPKPELSTIQARTNLNETAFFYPHLQTDENGDILIGFTIPEALTRWKMLGFAHTKDLKYGFAQNELVTQKELMVTPNAPRFFRENDTLAFTAKIASLSGNDLNGSAQLMLFDGLTMKPVDTAMHNNHAQQNFTVKKGESTSLNWNIIVPSGLQAVTYRVVAQSGRFSDGEESSLPVLTNSMMVTETLPLPVKGRQTKTYTLDKLVHNTSATLRNHKLTLEFTSNPAWYAIQALPYLMEYPYECAEQTFSRFYANSIASHIANSSPRIKQVFDSWKNITPGALLSNLEKNQELKGLLLEETPWVCQAQNESERKQRVALLFDLNRMSDELGRALDKLNKMQVPNGGWPWFEGMPDDRYITQHIICGMGKLDHLGIKDIRNDNKTWRMVSKAIAYADDRIAEDYQELKRLDKAGKLVLDDNHTGYTQIHYLYVRSFFNDISMNSNAKEALDYYLGQTRKYWLKNNFYLQGMIALALNRYHDVKTPSAIIRSFREHAITSDEMGMYWKNDNGWFWYQAPVETQALMIEAFDEVAHDTMAVNEMKVWLLKQKQTQDWKTTRATVEACYALLLRGTDWLATDNLVDISVGNQKIDPHTMPDVKIEAGTGYFKTSWTGQDIQPGMGNVTIAKQDNGVSWGALYWQYFEQLDKITAAETPLKLRKQLFVERNTNAGPVIQPVSDTTHLKPGDLLKVRIELRVDRDMEYVHMKDMRAAGLEPTNVLSRYKYQDGLGYYESTRDAATNFFFYWLPKGTYVFEYPLRVTHYGNFSNGITTIQSMYAPEFTSHSEGVRIKVKKEI
jgi:uncharacterized protein YfaS (alpha-2-macroglobulin family)